MRRPKLRCLTCEIEFLFRGDSFHDEEGRLVLDWGVCPHCNEALFEKTGFVAKRGESPIVIACSSCDHIFRLIPQPAARRPRTETVDEEVELFGENEPPSKMSDAEREILAELERRQEENLVGVYNPEASEIGPREVESPTMRLICDWFGIKKVPWPERKVLPDRKPDPRFFKCVTCGMKLDQEHHPCICSAITGLRLSANWIRSMCKNVEFDCEKCPLSHNEQCILEPIARKEENDAEEE
jgi:hypothetical protein